MKLLYIFLFLYPLLGNAVDFPRNTGPVVDQVGVFSSLEIKTLSQSLWKIKRETDSEIQVVVINSLQEISIEQYSIELAQRWKIGNKKTDRGIIFLVAIKDRKMRIEVGDGLEGVITDLEAGRIIQSASPYFKKSRYRDGIVLVTALIAQKIGTKLDGTYIPQQRKREKKYQLPFLVIFLIIFLLIGRSRGVYIGGSRGGFYGGGFSSGGGSFGGGGGFSGGGASGSW
jgi:uncharacterized protein